MIDIDSDMVSNADTDILPDAESDMVSDVESDMVSDVESDMVSDAESDMVSDVESDMVSDVVSDVDSDMVSNVESDINADMVSDVNSDMVSDAESDMVSDADSDINADMVSDVESDMVSDAESDMVSNVDSDINADMVSNVESDMVSNVVSDVDSDMVSDAESDMVSNVESDINADMVSDAESDMVSKESEMRESHMDIEQRMYPSQLLSDILQYKPTKNVIGLGTYNFQYYLHQIIQTNDNVCKLESGSSYNIVINLLNFTYQYSLKLKDQIDLCRLELSSKRFIIIPILVVAPKLQHQNIIIIDNELQIIEYFEPYGDISIKKNVITIGENDTPLLDIGVDYNIEDMIKLVLSNLFPKRIGGRNFKPYKFVNVQFSKTNTKGLQLYGESAKMARQLSEGKSQTIIGGYCMAWCLLYSYIRVLCIRNAYLDIINEINQVMNINPLFIEHFITKISSDLSHVIKFENILCIKETQFELHSIIDLFNDHLTRKFNYFFEEMTTSFYKATIDNDYNKSREYHNRIIGFSNYTQFYALYFNVVNKLFRTSWYSDMNHELKYSKKRKLR
jgi:hypothetical protein